MFLSADERFLHTGALFSIAVSHTKYLTMAESGQQEQQLADELAQLSVQKEEKKEQQSKDSQSEQE
jgi:hypothetical protein